MAIEALEPRIVLSTIRWDAGAGAENPYWDLAANWEGDTLPGPNDDVEILSPGVTVTKRSDNITIKSLNSTADFAITGGSLTVTTGDSVVSGKLTVGPSTYLQAAGAGAKFTATGDTTADGSTLYAYNGGTLSLPVLTAYSALGNNVTFQAYGQGSLLDLSHLTTILGGGYWSSVDARAYYGATLDLSAWDTTTDAAVRLYAEGTDANGQAALVDAPALTWFGSTVGNSSGLDARNGGRVRTPNVTELYRVFLRADGSGLDTKQIAKATSSSIYSDVGAPDFSALTNADGSSFYAGSGATLSFPALTAYSALGGNPVFQAYGSGSRIDLSHLKSTTGGGYWNRLNVNAYYGATVDLSAWDTTTDASVRLYAEGTDADGHASLIDASALAWHGSTTANPAELDARNGGLIKMMAGTVELYRTDVWAWNGGVIRGGVLHLLNGSINGNSTIDADVVNAGLLRPGGDGVGQLTIDGSFTNLAGGTLAMQIGGTTPGGGFDQLVVTGQANVGGTLNVSLVNGFTPNQGDTFAVISAASRQGSFAAFAGLEHAGNRTFRTAYNPADVTLLSVLADIRVTPESGLVTTEAGGTASFSVVLGTKPSADVTIDVASSDPTEGTVSASSLTFTPDNWNVPQVVTVTGLADTEFDGEQAYKVVLSPARSLDPNYDGLNPDDVAVTNVGNDLRDLRVENLVVLPDSGLQSGSGLVVRWDVVNDGNMATSGVWHDRVTIRNATTNQVLGVIVVTHDEAILGPLAAGSRRTRQVSFTLPDGPAGAGDLRFSVETDSAGEMVEANGDGTAEANNSAETAATSSLALYADLQAQNLRVDPSTPLTTGASVVVRW